LREVDCPLLGLDKLQVARSILCLKSIVARCELREVDCPLLGLDKLQVARSILCESGKMVDRSGVRSVIIALCLLCACSVLALCLLCACSVLALCLLCACSVLALGRLQVARIERLTVVTCCLRSVESFTGRAIRRSVVRLFGRSSLLAIDRFLLCVSFLRCVSFQVRVLDLGRLLRLVEAGAD
jgi:hypothetical protein